jgi:hypothetical protein
MPAAPTIQYETIEVGVPVIQPVPERLTRRCERPEFPERVTVNSLMALTAKLYTSVDICNGQLDEIEANQIEQ